MLLKLLIVDDKPSEREGIANIIDWESIGITVVGTAENGLDGVEKARELKPDIIITDIVMPHLDGFKMVEAIREFIPNIKVIFISCFDNFSFAKSAINVNAMGYVLKPIIVGELMETVSKVTGLHIKEVKEKKEEVELIRRLRENFPVLRDQFIRDILFGFLKDEKTIWEKNDFLEVGLEKGHYTVLAIECDDLEDEREEQKQLKSLKVKEYIWDFCRKQWENKSYYVTCIEKFRYAISLFEKELFIVDTYYIQFICITIIYYIQINLLELNEKPSNIMEEIFMTVDRYYKLNTVDDAKHWLKNLIWKVSSYMNSKDRRKNKKVIEVLKNFMHENYNKDLTVAEIAQKAYLSPCYANYIFKKETGVTLMEYLTRIRMEEAQRLLRNSLLKVYEIADMVGYKSSSYFSSVFKEHFKMTPLEFRDRR